MASVPTVTPNADVTFVRTNSAFLWELSSAPHDSAVTKLAFTDASQSLTGFARNLRSYR